jgi:thymidylate synthase (FAD)
MKVLNHGYIEVKDYLPKQENVINYIANIARISYGHFDEIEYSVALELVKKMFNSGHSSPFEKVVILFEVKCPLFISKQWMRHRTGSYNEISARYTEVKPEFYIPSEERYNQFKNDDICYADFVSTITTSCEMSYNQYLNMCRNGVPKEVSRSILPYGMYTTFYFKMDLHNLFHFLELRQSSHAQYEIREYAKAIVQLLSEQGDDWKDLIDMFIKKIE